MPGLDGSEPASRTSGLLRFGFAAGTRPGDDGLRCRQAGDGHTEWTATDVVEAGIVEKLDALRVATVLATHAQLQTLLHAAAAKGGDADQFADAVLVDGLE